MTDAPNVAASELRQFIERIERLESEKQTIADDIKDVKSEAKGRGYDIAAINAIIKLRKKDANERAEEESILATYMVALGMAPAFEPVQPSREERRRQLTSEAMADHKSLVDEMADAGLISEEARHENKALADAVATKFGNGPAMALQSPRKAAEAVSERTANQSLANEPCDTVAERPVLVEADKASAVAGVLGQPETIPALTVQHDGVNVSGPERADVTDRRDDHLNIEMDRATEGSFETGSEAAEKGRKATATVAAPVDLNHAGAGESPAIKIAKVAFILRPHCRNQGEACAGHGSNHCHACTVAMREGEAA